MPIVIVKFPNEKWRKVNVSRFLNKFKAIPASKIVDVPDEELDRVIEVLRRNKCDVKIVEPVKEDIEIRVLKEIIKKIESIRLGFSQPEELGRIAVDAIAKFSLLNLGEEISELLHDCIDFSEQPFISDLNEIQKRAEELLKTKLN